MKSSTEEQWKKNEKDFVTSSESKQQKKAFIFLCENL